ncbi:MAG: methyltransferase, partial [Spirochaetes bacterium]|nr:methyltransferase [Spirochaetota bacterium]
EEAVEGTRRNVDALGTPGPVDIRTADARDLDEHYARGSVDAIVTNPPFGIRMHKEADFRRLYRRFLETAHLILAPHGVIVILVGKKRGVFNKLLRELGLYDLLEVRIIEIGGVYPGIFVLRRRGAV